MEPNDNQDLVTNTPVEVQETPPAVQETPSVSAPSTPPAKNNKKTTIILISLLCIAIIAAAIFAVLFFMNQPSSQPTGNTPEPEQPVVTESEETEITDTLLKRDLDEKMAILHGVTQVDSAYITIMGQHRENPLYIHGSLSDIAKVAHIAQRIDETFYLSADEIESVITENNYEGEAAIFIREQLKEGIKYDVLAAKYVSVFGEQPPTETISNQSYCPGVAYNKTYNFYYNDIFGCGGTGPYVSSYYKSKYTVDDSHAYVYVSAGTVNGEDNKIYCDVINIEDTEVTLPEICGEWNGEYSSFTLDSSNYQNYAQYRFVFNLADDGTYYFNTVEKF